MIVIKTVNDYVDDLCELYPTIDKRDIKRICNFGWKSLYLLNSYGGDVIIESKKLWCYFGSMYLNSIKYFSYYKRKLALKIRVLYKRNNIKWDGYYYFALNNKLYEEYLSLKKSRGRKRVHFTFNNIILYKILDECKVNENACKYIFKVVIPTDYKYKIFKDKILLDSPELIITRSSQKLKDILVSNNNYELL